MLVALEPVHGDELVVETPGLRGGGPPLLRAQCESVLLLARDLPAFGHVLPRLAHGLERQHLFQFRVRKPPAERRVPHGLVATRKRVLRLGEHERGSAHRLHAARDEQVAVAGRNRVTRGDDGGEAGRAQPIHRDAGDALRQTREQHGHARDVAVVFPCLVRTSQDHVSDVRRINRRIATQDLGDCMGREIIRAHVAQTAREVSDRRPNAADDECITHYRFSALGFRFSACSCLVRYTVPRKIATRRSCWLRTVTL